MQASERGRIPAVLALLGLAIAAVGVLLYLRRAPHTDKAPSPADPAASTAGADPLHELFGEKLPEKTVRFLLPELPFEEHSKGLPESGTWRGYPLLHDFTGDGMADLVVSNREEDGYNTWEFAKGGPWIHHIEGLDRTMAYGPARAADMNSDGIPDLVLSAHTDALRVYLNDGHMSWTLASRLPGTDNPNLLLDIAVGNLNGDGMPDVAGIANFDGGLSVLVGDGKASVEEGHPGLRRLAESRTLIGTKPMGSVIELADLDGDGIDDIVAATSIGAKAFLTRAGETMSWEDVSAGLPNPKIGNSIYATRVARFVPGAWPQIALCGLLDPTDKEPDTIGVYAWDPASKTWDHIDTGLPRGAPYRDLAAADFDRDGNMDILALSLTEGGAIYRGDGKGGFEAAGRLPGVTGSGCATVGDIDGDGWVDIIIVQTADKDHPEQGSVRAFLNRPGVWQPKK